jgi:hypothetical protein
MQVTGNRPVFDGFGGPGRFGNEQLVHRVPAVNLHTLINLGSSINLLGEYVGAINAFNTNDLMMNSHGAKPQALTLEAAYTFPFLDKAGTLALGYGRTRDALAIGLPLTRYSVVFNTSIWQDTLQSLEFRHDINYAASNTATGSNVMPLITGPGKPDNTVTAQFDMYF